MLLLFGKQCDIENGGKMFLIIFNQTKRNPPVIYFFSLQWLDKDIVINIYAKLNFYMFASFID
jgi:hypothetical protein